MRICKKNKGFTLSEMLFVLLSVAFIMVLMVPGIKLVNAYKARSLCAEHFRQIGLALYIYAGENNGRFPEDIATIYEEKYLTNENLLDCPASSRKGTLKNPEYVYTGGLSVESPAQETLLIDKEGNHKNGGRNVLDVNGKINWEKH